MAKTPYIKTGDKTLVSQETELNKLKLSLEYVGVESTDPQENLLLSIYFLNDSVENKGIWMEFTYIPTFLDYELNELQVDFNEKNANIQCQLCTDHPDNTVSIYKLNPIDGTVGTITAHKRCMNDLQKEVDAFYRSLKSTEQLLSHIL